MDIISYVIGLIKGREQGKRSVEIEGTGYIYRDTDDDGNVEIKEGE